jgi:hypothetical protein
MALVGFDGFDHRENTVIGNKLRSTVGGPRTCSASYALGNHGGQGAEMKDGQTTNFDLPVADRQTVGKWLWTGIRFKPINMTSGVMQVGFESDDTELWHVTLQANGTFRIALRGNNLLVVGDSGHAQDTTVIGGGANQQPAAVAQGSTYFLEVGFKMCTNTGATIDSVGTIELWLNGVRIFQNTAVRTRLDEYETFCASVSISGGSNSGSGNVLVDDWYIVVEKGSYHNTRLGDSQVLLRVPANVGDLTQFNSANGEPNFANEAVVPGSLAALKYNYASDPGKQDLYRISPLNITSSRVIHGAQLVTYGIKSLSGDKGIQGVIKSVDTELLGTDVPLPETVSTYVRTVAERDPDGGGAWTVPAVDLCQIGMKVKAT